MSEIDREKSIKGVNMAKTDAFNKGVKSAESAALKGATVNIMKKLNDSMEKLYHDKIVFGKDENRGA